MKPWHTWHDKLLKIIFVKIRDDQDLAEKHLAMTACCNWTVVLGLQLGTLGVPN